MHRYFISLFHSTISNFKLFSYPKFAVWLCSFLQHCKITKHVWKLSICIIYRKKKNSSWAYGEDLSISQSQHSWPDMTPSCRTKNLSVELYFMQSSCCPRSLTLVQATQMWETIKNADMVNRGFVLFSSEDIS